jgi:hypothetical protein
MSTALLKAFHSLETLLQLSHSIHRLEKVVVFPQLVFYIISCGTCLKHSSLNKINCGISPFKVYILGRLKKNGLEKN